MSTQPRVTQQPLDPKATPSTVPVTQQHVDTIAQGLNQTADALRTRQQQLDAETMQTQQQRGDAAKQREQAQADSIRAAAKAQATLNKSRETAIREQDHVVIDTERLPHELRTAFLMGEMRRLRQQNAHMQTGRVVQIEGTPNGRVLHVEGPQNRWTVPEPLAVRADHMADELDL
jgi:hypothetical protein